MRSLRVVLSMIMVSIAVSGCSAKSNNKSVQQQLSDAKESGNTVFMVVTNKEASADKINSILNEVVSDMKKVSVIQMNADDEKNAELVKEYRLSGAPMPLLLLFSDKGIMLGGMIEDQITKESLIEAIPTPKYSEIIYALSQGKPVFAIVSNSSFDSDKKAIELCNDANKEMQNKAEAIVIDAKDSQESKLITMLNIKEELKDSYIVVINGQGLMSGRFDVLPSQAELVDAAIKVVQSGCAPGGCTPTCK